MPDAIDDILNPNAGKIDKIVAALETFARVADAILSAIEHTSALSPQMASVRPALSAARQQLDAARAAVGELKPADGA